MASTVYPLAREAFLAGDLSWRDNTIKVALVDGATYTYDAAHQYLSDIPSGARTAISAALSSKTVTLGVADAADAVFTGATGNQSEMLVVFQDSGSAATSRLICMIDTATGLPFTPNGGDLTVVWDNGANKIFKL